jgi:exopolyphosphatase/guanosine-5'-triphosphate,3'-diphosphate pyrophosphatase
MHDGNSFSDANIDHALSAFSRRAVIDVGTNSVKLLVADTAGGTVLPLFEQSEQTRLGQGLYGTHRLRPEAIQRTARAVDRFAALAAQFQPFSTRVIATSAARDAENQSELLDAIRGATGLTVEVISGDQEADWVFRGVVTDPKLAKVPLLILDVGGGSTEFILCQGSTQYFRQSFRMGTVRLLEKLRPGDPPSAMDLANCLNYLNQFLAEEVQPGLAKGLQDGISRSTHLVGTGGTATIMAKIELKLCSFDRDRIESTRLHRDQIGSQLQGLWSVSLGQRRAIAGLPPNRADVILAGVAIYKSVMECFDFPELIVSTRGLRYAAVMDDIDMSSANLVHS